MRKLFKLVFNRWVLMLLGLTAIGLVIWWVGPAISIFQRAPLASATVRWSLIALVCVIVIGKAVWTIVKARLAGNTIAAGLAHAPAAPADARGEEAKRLQERFTAALDLLKRTDLGRSKRSPLARLSSLATGSYLYELPWYVFIGAPGSGKTTALLNSGLHFPLAERFGKDTIQGVGGTRNCEWLFTDEAILLDTAGRYTTQESNQEVDASGWRAFMQLLKKSRPRRPINGVFLSISMADLLQHSNAEHEAHAQALRRRLKELYQDLGIRFPVYVLVTKADLLAGFNEYFAVLDKEERQQVWGFSLPYAEDGNGVEQIGKELELLERRLYTQLTARMHRESDLGKRALVYGFPQQFATAARRLNDLLERVFAPSKYEVTPLLRGTYFTSGTQEGNPIDRVMGQLARSFGLERKLLPPQRPSGRSYFLTRLVKDVVFAEAGLAGTNLKWERRRALIQFGTALAGIALVCIVATGWLVSYRNNVTYMNEVASKLSEVKSDVARIPAGATGDPLSLLPTLQSIHTLSQTHATADGNVPWSLGFGLYQGSKLEAASQAAYANLLNATFLPALIARLEKQLRDGFYGNPDLSYEALKTYVMLNVGKHFSRDDVQSWFAFDWEAMLPREVTNEQRVGLRQHLDVLYADGWIEPPTPQDPDLVAQVRRGIASTPLAQRIYARLRRLDIGKDYPDFTLSRMVPNAELVFHRRSKEPLSKGVPGLYTYAGYHESFAAQADAAAKRLAAEEAWVMGNEPASDLRSVVSTLTGANTTGEAVKRLYLEDYRLQWERFIKDVEVLRKPDMGGTIQMARVLSDPSANNPIKQFFVAVARQTALSEKSKEEKDLVDRTQDRAKSAINDLSKLLPGAPVKRMTQPDALALEKMLVDEHFRDLHQFAIGAVPGQPAPLDNAVALMGEIHQWLLSVDAANKQKLPLPINPAQGKVAADAPRYPEPLRSMVDTLMEAGAEQGGRAAVATLRGELRSDVTDYCMQAINDRYPFVRTSQRDVTQEDFVRLFAPGGVLDRFYQKHLADKVDTSSKHWVFRQVQGMQLPPGVDLSEFQKAAAIREVFFRGGAQTPALRFEFKPIEMDAAIDQFTLDVDGQLLKYAHGPQVPTVLQFPGPKGSNQVRVSISPTPPSGTSAKTVQGPWALFRLFDGVNIESTSQPERFFASIGVDGRNARFEIRASSVQNPFKLPELAQFHCPQSL